MYWWATTRPDGRPHIRPVLAVLIGEILYSTTNRAAGKARNLDANDRFAVSTSTEEIDFVVEGHAAPVTDQDTLERIAEAYHSKYGWPVTVRYGAFHAPYGAPTAGLPPYQPYALVPTASSDWAPPNGTPCTPRAGGSSRGPSDSRMALYTGSSTFLDLFHVRVMSPSEVVRSVTTHDDACQFDY